MPKSNGPQLCEEPMLNGHCPLTAHSNNSKGDESHSHGTPAHLPENALESDQLLQPAKKRKQKNLIHQDIMEGRINPMRQIPC